MGRFSDYLGTTRNTFQIGLGAVGAKILRFKGAFLGDLSWTTTANRTITLPDASGTAFLKEQAIASPLGAANAGDVVAYNSEGMVAALALRDRHFQRRRAEIFSDFIGGFGEWTSTVAGASAANSVSAVTSTSPYEPFVAPGIAQHNTGITDTGKAALMSSPTAFRFASLIDGDLLVSIAYFRAIFLIPAISNATQAFVYRLGFIDSNLVESADGCFLRVNADATAQFVCRSNNVETVVSLGTLFAGQIYNLEIVVSSSTLATAKLFSGPLNTTSPVTFSITTNIPAFQTRLTGAGSYLQKTVGTTPSTMNLDFMYAGMDT